MKRRWLEGVRDVLIRTEPALSASVILTEPVSAQIAGLASGAEIAIKISAAYDLPYPFSVSPAFVAKVVNEVHAANPTVRIVLMEGGVRDLSVTEIANKRGLTNLQDADFIDAEEGDPVFVHNRNPTPYAADGFWLPARWVHAGARILLTTCKLRSHHFQRWYSGGTRNLIGLVSRDKYKLSTSRRNMRSALHQQGMDAMVADLYTTTGIGAITILDARLLARQDEHLPLRFTRRVGAVLVTEDPYDADMQMAQLLKLPFIPPYLDKISRIASK